MSLALRSSTDIILHSALVVASFPKPGARLGRHRCSKVPDAVVYIIHAYSDYGSAC